MADYRVNNFEKGLDEIGRSALNNKLSNITYTFDGTEVDLMNDLDKISDFIEHHLENQRPRLNALNSYYEAQNYNLVPDRRRLEKHLADNRAAHDFAAYISDFINGYFLGNPIQIQHDDDKVIEQLNVIHDYNDIDSHNRSIGLDLSVYGRAYEYIIRNEKDEVKLYKSDVQNTFIIYDNTIEQNSLAAIRYWQTTDTDDEEDVFFVDIITSQFTYKYATYKSNAFKLTERDVPEPHAFERVTITELRNNERRRGDFEKVITLIDLYDNAQSDTANYMSDLNDAMLLVKGNIDLTTDEVDKMKQSNVFMLNPPIYTDETLAKETEGNVDAGYIYKQYDVQGTEAYKTRVHDDIHMFTNTPNIKDDSFSGTQSGEAMKYKLFGLEQRTKIKEGLFEKALKRRYKLIETILKNNYELDRSKELNRLQFTFNRNLPKAVLEELNAYVSAGGKLSQSTLMSLVSFIKNPELEEKKIEDEEKKNELKFGDSVYSDAGTPQSDTKEG